MKLNGRVVIDVEIDGVDPRDYPDFCDAYFSEAYYDDGTSLTDAELEALTELYPDIIYELAYESCISI